MTSLEVGIVRTDKDNCGRCGRMCYILHTEKRERFHCDIHTPADGDCHESIEHPHDVAGLSWLSRN